MSAEQERPRSPEHSPCLIRYIRQSRGSRAGDTWAAMRAAAVVCLLADNVTVFGSQSDELHRLTDLKLPLMFGEKDQTVGATNRQHAR